MSRNINRRSREDEVDDLEATITDRLIAVILAIPAFELSLFLVAYLAGRRTGIYILLDVPLWLHTIYIGAAIIVSVATGTRGMVWLLGHLFMTHFEQERDERMTLMLWVGLGCMAGITYLVLRN